MNKQQFIAQIAQKRGMTKKEVQATIDIAIEIIENSVKNGEDVTLVGFGTFSYTNKTAREGYKPGTREKIHIPAAVSPKFKAGKNFKNAVNGK